MQYLTLLSIAALLASASAFAPPQRVRSLARAGRAAPRMAVKEDLGDVLKKGEEAATDAAAPAAAVEEAAPQSTFDKIKSAGVAGGIAYAITEGIFWVFSVPLAIVSYHQTTGGWLDLSSADDQKTLLGLTAGFLTFARIVVPLRIGAALALIPTVNKYILKKDGADAALGGEPAQSFLEADPYWSQETVPVNTYKAKSPFVGKVLSVKRIVGENATGETCHIIIDHQGKMPYWEGQSWGVIPPGTNPKNGKPHSVRLYSIASSRYGDDMTGNTGSLCVRRATYWCPELGAEDPAKKGVCSNYLCDATPGTELTMTGPSGKVMLMPEEDPKTDLIMVATGTGIAPYRGFLRRLFVEDTPAAKAYKGEAWLFLGVANSDSLLYDDEFSSIKEKFPENFRYDLALSREQTNKSGGKMYIQDKVEEYADEVFAKLEGGAHIYFCGLKGMMPGIQSMLEGVAAKKGIDYEAFIKKLKGNKQWHVEVY